MEKGFPLRGSSREAGDEVYIRRPSWTAFFDRRKSMHFVNAKGILSAHNGMNVYRGCTHGCIYCDSRSLCYHINHPFEDIEVKQNAAELLDDALRRKRAKCMISTGSMCDPYLPCEKDLRLTRRCLEVIGRRGFGVSVLTKSDLILRDLDLYRRIHDSARAVVQMTLTTYDEDLCRLLEPGVCTTHRRYEVLKAFQKEGIPTVVWLCPVLPFINDTPENIRGILDMCFDAGVKGVMDFGMGVTLREGDREYFYQALDRHFPGVKQQYIRTFGLDYECPSPRAGELLRLFHQACGEHGVMHDPNEIFRWLADFPNRDDGEQMSMFSM